MHQSFSSSPQPEPAAGFDLVITGGRVIDPASGLDAVADVAIAGDRIAAVGKNLAPRAARRIDAAGKLVCPGLIDLHVHVYEWVTNFGVCADEAGVHAGVTTVVDQGSSGAWTFGGFKAHVIDKSQTDVRAFVSVNVAGALMGGMKGDVLHNPGMTDEPSLLALIARHPRLVKGIKCHGESGALSHWGTQVLEAAAAAGRKAGVPLYVHTGELFPVMEDRRPEPDTVLAAVLPLLKAGDTMAHIYSAMPDGIVGAGSEIPPLVGEALARGIHFDIGYGVNFSYRIARMMMAGGVYPHTISSDLHGDFNSYHDVSILDYSLLGAMSRLWGLGMPLPEVIRRATLHPAQVLGEAHEIGTLAPGSLADVSVLDVVQEPWQFMDGQGESLAVSERLLPWLTVRAGRPIEPSCRLLPDLHDAVVA
ncbi:amidohydrolase/deacetylase family metallohydrolase [Pigmentiphaga soli]|uniref:Amidohydrolase/deacetylase family metallohydrolase n=1 Tax=Pigmentiphaga soli TaxID=1007095 RepID=A0ABP8H7A9_9BURK